MRDNKGHNVLDFPKSYTVIDVETTGLDPARDSLIEVAALKIQNHEITDSFCSLIKPEVSVSSFITDLTGITNEQLSAAPAAAEVLEKLHDFIGYDILVGHNVHFDINFLYDNFKRYLNIPLENNYIDTLRLSKKYYSLAPSYKLSALADYLKIPVDVSHRALSDCQTTKLIFDSLQEASNHASEKELELLESLQFNESNPFYKKRIAVKGIPQLYSYAFMKAVAEKCNANLSDIFYRNCDYIVFSKFTYRNYIKGNDSEKFKKADQLSETGTLTILSETDWCKMLNLPIPVKNVSHPVSAKDITTTVTEFDETHPLYNKVCVFTGTLEKMIRKDAMQIVVDLGGQVSNSVTKKTNYLILGNNDYCPLIKDGKSSKQKKAESLKLAGSDIEIISEDVFYDMISED